MTTLQLATLREGSGTMNAVIANNWPTYTAIPLLGANGPVTGDGTNLFVTAAGVYVITVLPVLNNQPGGGEVFVTVRIAGTDRNDRWSSGIGGSKSLYGGTWTLQLAAGAAIQLFMTLTQPSTNGCQPSSLWRVTFVPTPDYRI